MVAIRLCVLALLICCAKDANANGLSTHIWISLQARTHLDEGPLKTLVEDEALRDMLVSGTMFPDGGYAVGDHYGEIAHWEPFQIAYLNWIKSNYSPPWSKSAEEHIAFLLGLSSHGMADQVFDSLYMARAKIYDAKSDWANTSMDEATDVAFMAKVGPMKVPARWIPTDVLIAIFKNARNYNVDEATLNRGQNLVGLAVAVVGMLGQDDEAVRDYQTQFPWATQHLDDSSVPGNPQQVSAVVAEYWTRMWKRLHDDSPVEGQMLASMPSIANLTVSTAASSIDARLSIVLPAHLAVSAIDDDAFEITDADNQRYAFSTNLFYGDDSHVLHFIPSDDFPKDQVLTLRLLDSLITSEGFTIDPPWAATFTTHRPEEPEIRPTVKDDACACRATVPGPSDAGPSILFGLLFLLGLRPFRSSWVSRTIVA